MFVIGVVDDEGVGERERRDIGERERERDLVEPAEEDFDVVEEDRLIGVFVLRCLGDDDDGDDVGATSAFASSGCGVGRKFLKDNVLMILTWI